MGLTVDEELSRFRARWAETFSGMHSGYREVRARAGTTRA
jgi:hypothetical protein